MADANATIADQLARAMAETRAHGNNTQPMPQPSDLRVLALALEAYATWLERDPNTYDADELARALEKVGVIDHYEWEPSSWVVEAVMVMKRG